MKLYYDFSILKSALGKQNIALTIGNFDGIHSGHRYLINNFVRYSMSRDLVPVVLTFSPHPYTHITGKQDHKIRVDDENYDLLSELGIDHIALLEFSDELKNKSGKEFISEILTKLPIRDLYLGHDFSLGANKEFGPEQLKKEFSSILNIVFEKPFIKESEIISSSLIRKILTDGNIKKVNSLLEHVYTLKGKVIKGNQIGTRLGFPTANISYDKSLHLPKAGVYFSRARFKNKTYRAAVNIGIRPSVTNDLMNTVEAYLLDFSENIYDEELELNLIDFIREERKFSSEEDLITQIKADVEIIKKKDYEKKFALIGKSIEHSLSPLVYSTLLEGFPVTYTLLNFNNEKSIGDLHNIVNEHKRVSITSPYKKYCFENSEVSNENLNELKAVNALRMSGNIVESENTDYLACNDLIDNYKLKDYKRIFLIGDGAMGTIIKKLFSEKGILFDQYSRKLNNIEQIVDDISQISNKNELMVINSCSRKYNFPKTDLSDFSFWDLNYSMPMHLKLFHTNNVNYIDGFELLTLQAKYALSFWNCKSS